MAEHPEPAQGQQEQPGTSITYAGALRAAHARVLEQGPSLLLGQDVGELGGVMQATAGLKQAFPEQVMDAPLNEPLIVGTAAGAGLHEGTTALAEIQFGDYSLNTYHWLVHLGNLYWQTVGLSKASVIVRMPTDPFGGGAIYHSMSVDGFFSAIPGLVMVMPSTSLDAYGLLISAAEYGGPVVFLEPKWCYRRALGPRLPGEPTDSEAIGAMKAAVMRGAIPNVDPFHVELGKAILRRQGSHLTIVAWGRAVHRALASASRLAQQGIEAEVIDLRTLVPPDMSTVLASVERTGRLLVASEDRVFAGLGREIQGAVVSKHPGMPTAVVGMMPIPGIPQNHGLEQVAALTEQQIEDAASTLLATKVAGSLGPRLAWLPAPYMIG